MVVAGRIVWGMSWPWLVRSCVRVLGCVTREPECSRADRESERPHSDRATVYDGLVFRLGTVKAKLTALVAFSALATLTSLPVLSWVMHRQLVDEVDDRVPEAVRGFELELSDDLRDLQATTHQLASDPRVVDGIGKGDRAALERAAKTFHEAYPDIDISFYDGSGALVAAIGVSEPIARASDVPGVRSGITMRRESVKMPTVT